MAPGGRPLRHGVKGDGPTRASAWDSGRLQDIPTFSAGAQAVIGKRPKNSKALDVDQ